MASVSVEHLTKRFGTVGAVQDLSFEVRDGELLVLLGPSGCGKSTVLRLLAGLEIQTEGTIAMDGVSADGLDPRGRNMAFVFQSYALYPQMTVRQNLSFPLVMSRFKWWFHVPVLSSIIARRLANSHDVRERVDDIAAQLGLSELMDRRPRALSGGQRQRVAVGRAMVRNPAVFLMDEPLSNLDAVLRGAARSLISRVHTELGATIVYVTHDQVEAMSLGTRVLVLKDGVLQQLDTPRGIYERPANLFVAGFVGNPPMNVVHGLVDGGEVRFLGSSLPLKAEPARALKAAGLSTPTDVLVGCRPEHLQIEPGEIESGFNGRVVTCEDNGAETIVSVEFGPGHVPIGERPFYVRLLSFLRLAPGSPVHLTPEVDRLVLFDPATGSRFPSPAEGDRPS